MKDKKEWFCDNIELLQNSMYRLAFSILKNEPDAQDAVQETIYKSYKNLDSLKDKRKFKAWIYKILSNTSLEILKKKEFYSDIEEQKEIVSTENITKFDTNLTLWNAVQKLQQPYRTAIILYYYEDMSVKEISSITGVKIDTVKKHLSRGREQIKSKIPSKEVMRK